MVSRPAVAAEAGQAVHAAATVVAGVRLALVHLMLAKVACRGKKTGLVKGLVTQPRSHGLLPTVPYKFPQCLAQSNPG